MRKLSAFFTGILLFTALSLFGAVTPDGSLWIGTEDSGVVRIGRNGKVLNYTVAGGQLTSDGIVTILTDSKGTLWLLGADGKVLSYSSLEGFKVFEGIGSPVTALSCRQIDGRLFAATSDAVYSFTPDDKSTEKIVALAGTDAGAVREISFAADGAIWLVCETAIHRIAPDGVLNTIPENRRGVSNLIALEIETRPRQESPEAGLSPVFWVLFCILALLAGLLIGRLTRRKPAESLITPIPEKTQRPAVTSRPVSVVNPVSVEKPAVTVKPAVTEEPLVTPSPVVSSEPVSPISDTLPFPDPSPVEETPSKEDDFIVRVRGIIEDNIATQKFGVDDIAAITGMSRIHVNRKLKAAGAPSPSVMLKEARMKAAAKFISEDHLPMSEVAQKCGFSSASYFATAFREHYGISPSDYKG